MNGTILVKEQNIGEQKRGRPNKMLSVKGTFKFDLITDFAAIKPRRVIF